MGRLAQLKNIFKLCDMAKKQKSLVVSDKPTITSQGVPRGKPFKTGNSFFLKRSTHEHKYLFESPERLIEGAVEYFEHVDNNPEMVVEARVEEGIVINHPVPHKRPYTPEGLANWLHCSPAWFRNFKRDQKDNPRAQEFLAAITWIENVIYNQQYTGAVVGIMNPSVVARKLGLADKVDIGGGGDVQAPVINVYTQGPPLAGKEEDVRE